MERYSGRRGPSFDDIPDEDFSDQHDPDLERHLQQSPMLPRVAPSMENNEKLAPPEVRIADSGQPKMGDKAEGSPTGLMAWGGFGCAIFSLASMCVSFASPYWYQTYPNSFNEFQNIGLWEVCLKNYHHPKDDSLEVFNECWWLFNEQEKFRKLREWIMAPWFISCQVLATMCLVSEIASVLTVALIFLHACPLINHYYHQIHAMFAASAFLFLATLCVFVAGTVFPLMVQDREWMPDPQYNFLSWGYGFFIISGLAATAGALLLYMDARQAYDELFSQMEQQTKAELDMLGFGDAPSHGDLYLGDQGSGPYHPSSSASYGAPSSQMAMMGGYTGPPQYDYEAGPLPGKS